MFCNYCMTAFKHVVACELWNFSLNMKENVETVLRLCVYKRHASGATRSVRHAAVQDCRSAIPVFTLNKIIDVSPSALLTTTSMHSMASLMVRANASAAILAVWHALDLQPVTASPAWSTRSTMTLRMEVEMGGYVASVIADSQWIVFVYRNYNTSAAICYLCQWSSGGYIIGSVFLSVSTITVEFITRFQWNFVFWFGLPMGELIKFWW